MFVSGLALIQAKDFPPLLRSQNLNICLAYFSPEEKRRSLPKPLEHIQNIYETVYANAKESTISTNKIPQVKYLLLQNIHNKLFWFGKVFGNFECFENSFIFACNS